MLWKQVVILLSKSSNTYEVGCTYKFSTFEIKIPVSRKTRYKVLRFWTIFIRHEFHRGMSDVINCRHFVLCLVARLGALCTLVMCSVFHCTQYAANYKGTPVY